MTATTPFSWSSPHWGEAGIQRPCGCVGSRSTSGRPLGCSYSSTSMVATRPSRSLIVRLLGVSIRCHGVYCCVCGEHDLVGYRTHLAQALLDSPAMRDLLAEAWDEGHRQHAPVLEFGDTPCFEPNPYRQEAR